MYYMQINSYEVAAFTLKQNLKDNEEKNEKGCQLSIHSYAAII